MKLVITLICLLFLMGTSSYGGQKSPDSQEGSRFGPPPEAYKACEGKAEGVTAQFKNPEGETITGTCRIADGRLVLRPDRTPGNPREGRRGPPPEAYKACEGKGAKSEAQFTNPHGEIVKGTCEDENGKMVLRPYGNRGEGRGHANPAPGQGH